MNSCDTLSKFPRLRLHAGDWVVVRSKEEILSILDERGRFEGLPFQPEMLAFCGRRMRVAKVAHKTCDTINKTGGRRMKDTVHLEGARCNGKEHGGCQADCVFFWKEAWLKRPSDGALFPVSHVAAQCSDVALLRATCAPGDEDSDNPSWVCQTTALYDATTPLSPWDIRQYVRDVLSGNHSTWDMAKLLMFSGYRKIVSFGIGYRALISAYNSLQRLRGGKPYPIVAGRIPVGQPTPTEDLDLAPGEWVQVKSPEEICATINANGFNRGMRFDMEMLRYSGERYRVQMRVECLINEQTGKMMHMKNSCIQLEDVYCRAGCTPERLGCPRGSNTYWREIWLRRTDGPSADPNTA